VSYGSGPRLPAEVGSDVAMCPMAPDLASRLGRAPALPRVPWLPVGHGFQAHVFKMPHVRAIMRLQDVQANSVVNIYKACRHASIVRLQYDYSATLVLWTTRLAPLQCQVTRQHDITLLIECIVAGDKTRRAHPIENIFATLSH
jgi:hypothetical protein